MYNGEYFPPVKEPNNPRRTQKERKKLYTRVKVKDIIMSVTCADP